MENMNGSDNGLILMGGCNCGNPDYSNRGVMNGPVDRMQLMQMFGVRRTNPWQTKADHLGNLIREGNTDEFNEKLQEFEQLLDVPTVLQDENVSGDEDEEKSPASTPKDAIKAMGYLICELVNNIPDSMDNSGISRDDIIAHLTRFFENKAKTIFFRFRITLSLLDSFFLLSEIEYFLGIKLTYYFTKICLVKIEKNSPPLLTSRLPICNSSVA